MSVFDLLFLLSALASLATLVVIAVSAIQGRWARAFKIMRTYVICVVAYVATGLAISFFKGQRVVRPGDPWCFDDWCLTVEGVSPARATQQGAQEGAQGGPRDTFYQVNLRISSRARRVTQRAKGAWLYLIDDRGRLYPPEADSAAVPLDVMLRPGESVITSRVFRVPNDGRQLGLITGHGGPYCGAMDFLVIGQSGCLFRKPAMVRIL